MLIMIDAGSSTCSNLKRKESWQEMGKTFHTAKFGVKTGDKTEFVDISPQIQQVIDESGAKQGLCVVTHVHSTAGVIVNSNGDPATAKDLAEEIDRLVPTRVDFHHQFDTPRDASAHVKAMLVGHSVTMPFEDGQLPTGCTTGVLFCEFDGPRDRTVIVQIWGTEV